jgi:Zn-dependent metalloprotease
MLTRAAIIVVPVLAVAAGAAAIFAPDKPVAAVVGATNAPTIQVGDNGLARYLTTPADQPIAPPADLPAGASPETAARAHLRALGAAFGIKDEAKELRTVAALPQGRTSVVRFQQTYGGLPVIGGGLAVTVNGAGGLLAINGETGDTADATTKATISAATARQHAIASVARGLKVPAAKLRASKPTLSLYDASLIGPDAIPGARPVWQLEVTAPTRADIDRYVLVDALGGQVALSFSQVEALSDPDRTVCDFQGA